MDLNTHSASGSVTHSRKHNRAGDDGASPLGDARSARILAKTIYRELRANGLAECDVISIATALLGQAASDMKAR